LSIIAFAGFLAIESQNNEEAVEIFKHGLEVATDDQQRSEMLGYIGDMYHEMGCDAKAFKLYRKALEYNPENVLVLNNYAYFLSLKDKDLKRALAMAEEAMRLEPNNASYIDTYAWVLHRMGDNAKAKTVMSQALSQSAQRDASLLAHYGDILWALGEKFMAETYWQKAVDRGFDKDAMQQHVDEIKSKTKTK
jgi:Flp pilus assembly protein TadD